MDGQIEEEEIIIETECPHEQNDPQTAKDLFAVFKPDPDEDDEFRWDEDPFEEYDPPAKKVKKQRKRRDAEAKSKTCIQKYKKDWENIPKFKKWLSVSLIGQEYFYCKTCKIDAKCGKSEIMRHMTSKKHSKNSQGLMPKVKDFEGLLCTVFTPIDRLRYEEINYTKIGEYADYLRKNNIMSILINDVIGEGMSLTVAERCLIAEEWAKECKRTKQYLMVQVGGAPLKEVIRMVRHAVSRKVNAILVLPDLYNRPSDHLDLLRYIKNISDYADNLPIWYHHCPKLTNVNIDMKKFLMDGSEIESFVGVIFNASTTEEMIAASSVNSRINLVLSTDSGVLGGAAHEFKSIMTPSLNFLPHLVHEIVKAIDANKLKEARELQANLNTVFDVINEHGNSTSAMKAAMNILSKINVGQVRRPLVEIWKKQIDQMQTEFKTLEFLT